MKATKLHIEYFRGFEELDINLSDSNVTLFIGVNGAGKTSVLDLIAYCMCNVLGRMFDFRNNQEKYEQYINLSDEIKSERGIFPHEINLLKICKELDFHFDIRQTLLKIIKNEKNTNKNFPNRHTSNILQVEFENFFPFWGYYLNIELILVYGNEPSEERVREILGKSLLEDSKSSLPIFTYYCEKDKFKPNVLDVNQEYKFSQLLAYNNIFTNTTTIFDDFVAWFRAEDDFEKNEKIKTKNLDYESRNLKSIRKVVNGFLSELSTEKFENLRIETKRLSDNISFEKSTIAHQVVIDKNGVEFQLAELSSGEKMLLMLVIDIARRLILANPIAEDALLGKGIILIDEIDLHLHPTWQRQVIPALTKTFPNLQFIISTHSPFVVQSVKMSEVVILENGKVRQFETEKEIDIESSYMSIVRDIFGIHSFFSAETESLLNEFREFRSQIMQSKSYNKVRFSELVHLLVSRGTEIEALVNREIAQIERLTKQNLELV
jgi:predicted ATP-binding protein involved in virulence